MTSAETPHLSISLQSNLASGIQAFWGESPLVSVIMPVYNGEKTIVRAVQSVLNQTYPNLELVIVDDGSQDSTVSLIQQFQDSRIRLVQQANAGTGIARNRAFEESRGQYIAFLDADDVWLPQKMEVELNTLASAGERIAFVYSGYFVFDEQGQLFNLPKLHHDQGQIFNAVLWKEGLILPSALMVHRSIYQTLEGFPTDIHMPHEDWYFSLRMSYQFPGYPTAQRLLLYQHSLAGRGRSKKFADHNKALEHYIRDNEFLKKRLDAATYEGYIQRQKKTLFCSYLMYNYWQKAVDFFPEIDGQILWKDTKGKLALLSMKTGLNWLYLSRQVYHQWLTYTQSARWQRDLVPLLQVGQSMAV